MDCPVTPLIVGVPEQVESQIYTNPTPHNPASSLTLYSVYIHHHPSTWGPFLCPVFLEPQLNCTFPIIFSPGVLDHTDLPYSDFLFYLKSYCSM